MNVEELLELMEETLEAGTAVPFAASKRVVSLMKSAKARKSSMTASKS